MVAPTGQRQEGGEHRAQASASSRGRRRQIHAGGDKEAGSLRRNTLLGELSAEVLGTFTLIIFVVGAFLAALVIRWNYYEAFNKFDPAKGFKSQVVFNTFPNNANPQMPNVSQLGALRDQIIGTAVLVMLVLAITDARNTAPGSNMAPFIIGLVVVGIGMTLGADAGYAINPARDLGPRLVAWVCGWNNPFNDQRGDFYAWVPIVGPLIGGPLGGYVYDWFVGNFLPAAEAEVGEVVETPGGP